MKILSVVLYKYKRFPLLGAKLIRIDFTRKLNLILGTNGSGKSSLMKELSPLPAIKDDFYADGFKEIVIEHNNSRYVLRSDFKGNQAVYSFVVDGEELNTAFLITTQKYLCEVHFRLTQDIYDILTGQQTFTTMSSAHRKKLINYLSSSNIDEILNLYDRIKEKEKQTELLLKTNISLCENEKNKLLTEESRNDLIEKKTKTHEQIEDLLKQRYKLETYLRDKTAANVYEDIKTLIDQTKNYLNKNYHAITSFDPYVIDNEIKETDNSIKSNITIIKTLQAEKNNLDEIVRISNLKKKNNLDELKAEIKQLEEDYYHYQNKRIVLKEDYNADDFLKVEEAYRSSYVNLIDIFNELPNNKDRKYSKLQYDQLQINLNEHKKEYDRIGKMIKHLQNDIEHMKIHLKEGEVTCPKCTYKWNIKYKQEDLDLKEKQLQQFFLDEKELHEDIEKLQKNLDEQIEYLNIYKRYAFIRKTYHQELNELWSYLDKKMLVFDNPRGCIQVFNQANDDLVFIRKTFELTEKLYKTKELLDIIEKSPVNEVLHPENRIKSIDEEIDRLMSENTHLYLTQQQLYIAKHVHDKYRTFSLEIDSVKELYVSSLNSDIAKNTIKAIDEELSILKVKHIEYTSVLNNQSKIKSIIEDYEYNIEKYQKELKVYKAMIIELSPKEGLIAKTIGQFINLFIKEINHFIAQIWSYPFEIIPYDLNSEDKLDYKFKVLSNDATQSPDITKTSSGMREIIDLAFKLTLMKMLNIVNYPLYLDEFGSKLDVHHKGKIFNMVFNFISSGNYSQIFMITHTDTSFANIKNTDIIVLDKNNISYNREENIMKLS